jgi:hypothetical protein
MNTPNKYPNKYSFSLPVHCRFRILKDIPTIIGGTMKRFLLPLLAVLVLSIAGCATAPDTEPVPLAGTKWIAVISFMGERNTLEFVHETNCIYTFYGEPKNYTYAVKGDKVKCAGDTCVFKKQGERVSFEGNTGALKNDTLLLRGNPYWAKE